MKELYPLPEGWRWVRLGEICEVFSGSPAPQDKKYFENGKYPFIRVQDLGKYGRTTDLREAKDYINDLAIKELKMIQATKGTILFPKSGAAIATNNRAILGIDAYIVSHLAALKPLETIADVFYIYFWLCNVDMATYMDNPGYPSLKLATISRIPIPLPPLHVQKRIAKYLNEKMREIEKLRLAIEKQLSNINALQEAILRKAFRGEL